MNFSRRLVVLLSAQITFAVLPKASAGQSPRKVSSDEAHLLAEAVAKSEGWTKLRGFGFERSVSPNSHDFYFFEATWDNPVPYGSVNVDHLAVDMDTGDVWNAVVCRKYSSKKLRSIQRTIRQNIGLTDKQYRQVKRRGPMC